jgi:hypothetical protein
MLNRSRIVALLAFSTAFSAMVSAPAHAQKPALTQNVDEKGRVPYHDSFQVSCNGTCLSYFKAVPQGYRLVVTHISGTSSCAQPPSNLPCFAELLDGTTYYAEYFVPTSAGGGMYIFSSSLTYYVESGDAPILLSSGITAAANYVTGTIEGYLVALN